MKMPAYAGVVRRGTNLPNSIREKQIRKVGGNIQFEGFLSTSARTDFNFSGKDQYLICSKNGRTIWDLSSFANEKEILFLPNSTFRVLQYKDDGISRWLLAEVDVQTGNVADCSKDPAFSLDIDRHWTGH